MVEVAVQVPPMGIAATAPQQPPALPAQQPAQPRMPLSPRTGFVLAQGPAAACTTGSPSLTQGSKIITTTGVIQGSLLEGSLEFQDPAFHHPVCSDDDCQDRYHHANSLNSDPYNMRSEELAVAECARGVEVRRTWSEQEMVRSFGGHMFPGTPDGVFESWDGELTCVQVVRVPIVSGMSPESMQETLAQTVLVKVIKSQHWLHACNVVPHDFVIFCWLPFTVPDIVAEKTYELMRHVQSLDPRFSLRLRVPAEPGDLFPSRFAAHVGELGAEKRCRAVRGLSDVSTFTGNETDSEDDEPCTWDITWDWDCSEPSMPTSKERLSEVDGSEGHSHDDSEVEMEWDITWEWQCACGEDLGQEQSAERPCVGFVHQEGSAEVPVHTRHACSGDSRVWDSGG